MPKQFDTHRKFQDQPTMLVPYGQLFEGDQIVYQETILTVIKIRPKSLIARAADGFESPIEAEAKFEVLQD